MYNEERGEREEEYSSSCMALMTSRTHDKIQGASVEGTEAS